MTDSFAWSRAWGAVAAAMLVAMVVPAQAQGTGGSTGISTGQTVVTSQSLTYDYKRSMVMFQGNVEVVDPQVRMKSDQLVIFFDPDKKEIKSARAEGNVRFYQEDRSATCNKALYMAQIGEVMLLGDARLERPDDVVMADKITFFVSDKALDSVKAEGNVRWKNKGTRGADRKPSETPVRN